MRAWFTFVLATLVATGASALSLTAPGFADGGRLPSSAVYEGFGCHGPNRSPELRWSSPPPATRSFAVTVFDPDAPTGSGWWHWVVFDLPPGTRRLAEGVERTALPTGAKLARNDYDRQDFGGACPPEKDRPHRYVFTVTALDIPSLGLDAGVPSAMVGFYLHQHGIASASIAATYGR